MITYFWVFNVDVTFLKHAASYAQHKSNGVDWYGTDQWLLSRPRSIKRDSLMNDSPNGRSSSSIIRIEETSENSRISCSAVDACVRGKRNSAMKTSRKWIFYPLILYTLGVTCNGQDYDEPDVDPRFHQNERSCIYRRQQGVCRRRSECAKPTRQICRFGLNPIVCCMDQPELKTTTTTRRPTTTRQSPVKPDSMKVLDLTYPGCGSRAPKIQNNARPSASTRPPNRRGGLFSRGKRSMIQDFSDSGATREKRGIQQPVVVGGVTAVANSWPWMVAIFKETNARTPKTFLCGASLISKKYVLSAAHCFDEERGNIDASKFFIVVGSHTTKDGTEYPVQSILIHPSYKQRRYYNDISLLRIRNDVQLTPKVYPVCLPSDGLRDKIMTDNNNVTVTGWGDTSFGGVKSQVLQELSIPIVPLKECNASYSKLLLTNFPEGITNLFICAGVEEGGKDACQGDSGGPLVSKLKDNNWVQLGVVSFGYGCAQPGFPGVYTRLSQYTKWLYDNTDLGKA